MSTIPLKQCEFPGCTHEFPEHYISDICGDKRGHMVIAVATAAHELWREQYRAVNGDKPRIKKTKDSAYVEANGTDQVDIAALSYPELPSDWQGENKLGAEVAVDAVLEATQSGRKLDENFVEEAATTAHVKWVERNGSWCAEELKKPYAELPEDEKEKDRFFVRKAIEAQSTV